MKAEKLNYEDSSDDEEVKFLSKQKGAMSPIRLGRMSEMCRRRRALSGKNGRFRRSLFMGLGRSRIGRGDLQRTRTDWGFGRRSHRGDSWPEHRASRCSDPSLATG